MIAGSPASEMSSGSAWCAASSTDGITADSFPFSHEFLGRAAARGINEVRVINRVV